MTPQARRSRRRTQRGAAAVEYALIAAMIAVVIIGSVMLFAGSTNGLFQKTCQSMPHDSATC
jgi:Flp pilus assembly pilin Flp